ncbi:hypothetical protein TanjilG_03107 [Lupinus angustifolius]|uniref:DUF4094 domain-containing protein n=1 Tax=Lupinus angustifolius TaxID=3871 RepID=A0A4P1RD85_LUPAN|nr:hypothetical protein TanjilG_03107 [Lupinus angustifolius]
MWAIPEPKGLARPTSSEAEKLNVVSEGCNWRILQEIEMKQESKNIYREAFKSYSSIETIDKTISNLEMKLAARESIQNGSPISENIRMTESSDKRKYLMVVGGKRKKLKEEKGIITRFVHRITSKDTLELSAKTKTYFITAVNLWDADFYVKVDDDVHVNIVTLGETLARHQSKPRIYIECMKSGPVLSQK